MLAAVRFGAFGGRLPRSRPAHKVVSAGSLGVGKADGRLLLARPAGLDSLLDMADKDVGQLSQVHVAAADRFAVVGHCRSRPSRGRTAPVGHSPAAVFVITNE